MGSNRIHLLFILPYVGRAFPLAMKQLMVAKAYVDIEKRTHTIGIYHERQPHASTDREPRRRDISRLFAAIAIARRYCEEIMTVRFVAALAPLKICLEAASSSTSNGFTYCVNRAGYIPGAPSVSSIVNVGRWDASKDISGTLFPTQESKVGIKPKVTCAAAMVVFRNSLVPYSRRQSSTGPHCPWLLYTKSSYIGLHGPLHAARSLVRLWGNHSTNLVVEKAEVDENSIKKKTWCSFIATRESWRPWTTRSRKNGFGCFKISDWHSGSAPPPPRKQREQVIPLGQKDDQYYRSPYHIIGTPILSSTPRL